MASRSKSHHPPAAQLAPSSKFIDFLLTRIKDPENTATPPLNRAIADLRNSLNPRPLVTKLPGYAFSDAPKHIKRAMTLLAEAVVMTLEYHRTNNTLDSDGAPITSLRQLIKPSNGSATVSLMTKREEDACTWLDVPVTQLNEEPDVIKLSLRITDTDTAHLLCHVGDTVVLGARTSLPAVTLECLPDARFPPGVLPLGKLQTNQNSPGLTHKNIAALAETETYCNNLRRSFRTDMLAFLASEYRLNDNAEVAVGDTGAAISQVIEILQNGANFTIDESTGHNVKVAAIFLLLKGRIHSEHGLIILLENFWSGNWVTYDAENEKGKGSQLLANKISGDRKSTAEKNASASIATSTLTADAPEVAIRLIENTFDEETRSVWEGIKRSGLEESSDDVLEQLEEFIVQRGRALHAEAMREWRNTNYVLSLSSIPLNELIEAAMIVTGMTSLQFVRYAKSRHTELFGHLEDVQLTQKMNALFTNSSGRTSLTQGQLQAMVALLASDVNDDTKSAIESRMRDMRCAGTAPEEAAQQTGDSVDELVMPPSSAEHGQV